MQSWELHGVRPVRQEDAILARRSPGDFAAIFIPASPDLCLMFLIVYNFSMLSFIIVYHRLSSLIVYHRVSSVHASHPGLHDLLAIIGHQGTSSPGAVWPSHPATQTSGASFGLERESPAAPRWSMGVTIKTWLEMAARLFSGILSDAFCFVYALHVRVV